MTSVLKSLRFTLLSVIHSFIASVQSRIESKRTGRRSGVAEFLECMHDGRYNDGQIIIQ